MEDLSKKSNIINIQIIIINLFYAPCIVFYFMQHV
jgi:hypothetical protein